MTYALLPDRNESNAGLRIARAELPSLAPNQVLIDVGAAGVNRADLLQRAGHYPPPKGASTILGLEVAGTVIESQHRHWTAGDRVMALLDGGGYSQQAIAEGELCMPMPQGFDFHQAAATPEAFLTAYQCLVLEGRLVPGQSVLIHGGAGGVGHCAIQVANALGANVYTTVSTDDKAEFVESLGATPILYHDTDVARSIEKHTGKRGVDLLLDALGGGALASNIQCLAVDSTLVNIAMMSGRTASLDFSQMLKKRITLKSSTLRSRSLMYKSQLVSAFKNDVLPLMGQSSIYPRIDGTYHWLDIDVAHDRMRKNLIKGKVALAGHWFV
ncbi:NAD(P)H-quinone oxidoreductase [Echinimonas agarilytica]|uniref:NAD(P)H-quinone oxidoreductase n=1 Tax=Echinimonas agarilytica TaxID=1215918 RepID=A0AA42B865_9GAMM|nr:NAD(P)H-quinone oxidoreductase [Echinimonas agarilytica]MCM2680647.1 NAD(P)H-quinone oxidoreductase [Echinimonas agarilytica]